MGFEPFIYERTRLRSLGSSGSCRSIPRSIPAFSLTMSQVQTSENPPVLYHEYEAVTSSSDDRPPRHPEVLAVDDGSEPIVTRKELWSYYRMSFRNPPVRVDGLNTLLVYYNGDNSVGPVVSSQLVSPRRRTCNDASPLEIELLIDTLPISGLRRWL